MTTITTEPYSSFVSEYHPMFIELGYPQLDIIRYWDGEWSIIEMENAPLIPSMTKWRHVFSGFKNIEPTQGFIKKMIDMIDLQKAEAWALHEKATEESLKKSKELDSKRTELASGIATAVSKNENLSERVLQNGLEEINLKNLIKHIPQSKWRDLLGPSVKIYN